MSANALFRVGLLALATTFPMHLRAAATIVILNNDGAGEGFNDPTAVAPVGGNAGTTLGQQRLIAFQAAANIWGAQLTSIPTIVIRANFDPLSCTATSAVLGSAGPVLVFRDFPGAIFAGTWYHSALANKLNGSDLSAPDPDIAATFNANLGQAGCLTGIPFYYGLDNNHGNSVDLVAVLLHEFAHGLGYSTTTSGSTGVPLSGFPSTYDRFTFDLSSGLLWTQMTNAQRVASAINPRKVVWTGPNVTAGVPNVLASGTPQMTISAPPGVVGTYLVGTAAFGPALPAGGILRDLMPVVDTDGSGAACNPLNATNAAAVNNNIALIDRGICAFPIKVKNAQNAGAVGVVIADDTPGSPPGGLGGSDPTITIPSVRITLADGNALKAALRFRSRTRSGVMTTLLMNLGIRTGADAANRLLLFTPNPFQGGSSVSHADQSASPNQLMEPAINGDLTHSVISPQDLTKALLLDIGWT